MKNCRFCALVAATLVLTSGLVSYAQKITTDPNAGQPSKPVDGVVVDPRLAKKITYEAWHTPVKTILAELSQSTGVTLNAGYNLQDWQVRDRKMNIYVKNVTLAQLMNSIARVMNFKWSRNDDLKPSTYRLVSDYRLLAKLQAEASRREKELKREETKRRTELLDDLTKIADISGAELQALRKTNPYLHLCATTGFAKMLTSMFAEEPRIKDAFINANKNAIIRIDKFTQPTQQNYIDTLRKFKVYDRVKGNSREVPDNLDPAKIEINLGVMTTPFEYSIRRRLSHFGNLGAWADGDYGLGSLKDPDARSTQAWAESLLSAQEQGVSGDGYYERFYPDVDKATAKDAREIEYYLMLDPVVEHPDEQDLHKKIKAKVSDETKKALEEEIKLLGDQAYSRLMYQAAQKAIADAAGMNIISDSFSVILADEVQLPDEDELLAVLDTFTDTYRCNWEKHGSIIEMRRRDWFRRRSSQIPDEWLVPWKDELEKNGVFSLENYAQVVALTDEQQEECIYSDYLLRQTIQVSWEARNCKGFCRFYLQLNDNQRKQIFTEDGLDPHTLTPGQWAYYTEMFDYGHRYAYTLDTRPYSNPGSADVKLWSTWEVTESGTIICKPRVVLTHEDGTTTDNGWWITLFKIKPPKDDESGITSAK